jgi:uncharacterized membrane protein YgcG
MAASERILEFTSLLHINADASLTVTETIRVQAAGREIKRGLVRDFPTSYRDHLGNRVQVGFNVLEVLRDGRPEPYHTKAAVNGVQLFIGKKDVFLTPGQYTYTIRYQTDGQLGFFKDYDELYWNVTGHGWTFPILRAEAVVELPPGAKLLQYAAYTGGYGSREQAFRLSYDAARRPVFTTTRPLGVKEGLTIAVAWPKGLVHEPSPSEQARWFLRNNLGAVLGLIWLLIVLVYYLAVWHRVGRDPEAGTIVPLFAPPQGFSPPATRMLMRMGFDDKAFAAAVVDLAVQGRLLIEEGEDGDYALRRRPGTAPLPPAEQRLLQKLFSGTELLRLQNTNHAAIRAARDALKSALETELTRIYFNANYSYLIPGVVLSLLALGTMVLAAPHQVEALFSSLWLTGWSIGVYLLGVQALQAWRRLRAGFRFGRLFGALGATLFVIPFLLFLFFGLFSFATSLSYLAASLFAGLGLTNALFVHLLKAPTLRGRQVMDQVEGFKLYLSVAEQERLNILHPPEKTPQLFEQYLPYALALDVENQWSQQFADVLAKAQVDGQPYHPGWYHGSGWHPGRVGSFTDRLGSSFASAIASSASPPGSSSGSGGGGFSGGGGGGGGGSGW